MWLLCSIVSSEFSSPKNGFLLSIILCGVKDASCVGTKAANKLNQIITKHGLTVAAQNKNRLHLKDKIQLEVNNKMPLTSQEIWHLLKKKWKFIRNWIIVWKKTGIGKNILRQHKTLKTTRIKLKNTLDLPALLYSSENWTIKARDARRITIAEMKYIRKTAWYTWTNYNTNTKIAKELNMIPDLDKI